MQSKNIILASVVLAVVVLGVWFLMKPQNNPPAPTSPPVSLTPVESASLGKIEENTVAITADGFSSKEVRIKAGGTVTWVNNDPDSHQVNSDPHPTHTAYPPLNTISLLKLGEKKSLMFPDQGTYKYHDHLNPSLSGSVVVE
ncbi:cupredoxin domain-containing protein [Candidatus Daviesbacteria bacterium]|nr:cupredoxin domain-containing protein [Candidatus Daviesbacteria bacterium]